MTNDYQIEFGEDKTLDELATIAEYINSFPFVINVTLNLSCPMGDDATTNDTLYNDGNDSWNESSPAGDNWGLATLKVFSAWDNKNSFATVKVGIYDTGFAPYHEDLRYEGLINNSNSWDHGTHVAGIIAAIHNNGKGIAGVASNENTSNKVKLYACGVGTVDRAIMGAKEGFTKLIGNHVKVINISSYLGSSPELCIAASHPELGQGSQNARAQLASEASDMESFLTKFIAAGYDFVICNSAGNFNNTTMLKADIHYYPYGIRKVTTTDNLSSIGPDQIIKGADALYNSVFTGITDSNIKDRIIVVGNMTKNGTLAPDSCIGTRVDVVAPGTTILSTVPTSYNSTGYDYMSGTSMASPHVAGIIALMYQINPDLRGSNIKRYLINSATLAPITSGNYSYPIPDASNCVDTAKSVYSNVHHDNSWPSGMLSGQTEYNGAALGNVSFTAYRKSSGEYNVGTYEAGVYSFTFESDANGDFTTVLPQGVYDITVYKANYLPFCIQDVTINPDETTFLGTVSVTTWSHPYPLYGTSVEGEIKDAISGNLVSGVTVKFRKGWNNETGAYAKDIYGTTRAATTDSFGKFSCNLASGAYTAEISKNGYVTGYYNVISTDNSGATVNKYTMVISPVLSEDEYRIVLTWGSIPSDLDSHLSYYVDGIQTCHVYYNFMSASYNGETIATLDLDDVSSYGPETVTITVRADLLEGEKHFSYSVQDFTNRNSTNSYELSMSDATIHVYSGNSLLNTYYVPKSKMGTVWNVFDIYADGLHAVNSFENISNPAQVG